MEPALFTYFEQNTIEPYNGSANLTIIGELIKLHEEKPQASRILQWPQQGNWYQMSRGP